MLKTLTEQNERINVYNHSTGNMFPMKIEKNIKKVCSDEVVLDFLKTSRVYGDVLFECTKLLIFGTQYHRGQYVLLPETTNTYPSFGKIMKLLYSENEFAFLKYQKTSNSYCSATDLYFITLKEDYGIICTKHIADFHPLGLFTINVENLLSKIYSFRK